MSCSNKCLKTACVAFLGRKQCWLIIFFRRLFLVTNCLVFLLWNSRYFFHCPAKIIFKDREKQPQRYREVWQIVCITEMRKIYFTMNSFFLCLSYLCVGFLASTHGTTCTVLYATIFKSLIARVGSCTLVENLAESSFLV